MLKNPQSILILAVALLIVIMFAIPWTGKHEKTGGGQSSSPERKPSVTVGYLQIAASLPLFVAVEEGLLQKQGYDVELVPFKSSNDLVVACLSGQVDIMASCAVNAAIDAAVASQRTPVAFLVNQYRKADSNGRPTDHLIVQKGMDFSNLKGKTVAFFPGSVSRVFAKQVFEKHNISIDEITYVELNPPEWLPALESGRIQAVNAVEPAATLILDNPKYESLVSGFFAEVQPNVPLSAFWYGPNLADDVRAKIRTAMQDALKLIEEQPNRCLPHFQKYTTIPQVVYDRIGLNAWAITFNNDEAKTSLQTFVEHLKLTDAIQGLPVEKWME